MMRGPVPVAVIGFAPANICLYVFTDISLPPPVSFRSAGGTLTPVAVVTRPRALPRCGLTRDALPPHESLLRAGPPRCAGRLRAPRSCPVSPVPLACVFSRVSPAPQDLLEKLRARRLPCPLLAGRGARTGPALRRGRGSFSRCPVVSSGRVAPQAPLCSSDIV